MGAFLTRPQHVSRLATGRDNKHMKSLAGFFFRRWRHPGLSRTLFLLSWWYLLGTKRVDRYTKVYNVNKEVSVGDNRALYHNYDTCFCHKRSLQWHQIAVVIRGPVLIAYSYVSYSPDFWATLMIMWHNSKHLTRYLDIIMRFNDDFDDHPVSSEPQDCLATDIVFILDYSGSVNVEDWTKVLKFSADVSNYRVDSRFVPSQWETPLQMASNGENISNWWRHHTGLPHINHHRARWKV